MAQGTVFNLRTCSPESEKRLTSSTHQPEGGDGCRLCMINVCHLSQAWKNMLEELENTAKLIKQNADLVESKSLDKLNSLYAEKRRARKHYQEEHNRIVAQFTHVSTQYTVLLIICSRVLLESVVRFCLVTYMFSPSPISDVNDIFEQPCKLWQIVSGFNIGM